MRLKAPNNFTVSGEDGACAAKWEAVEGAIGYKLYFFRASEPENCIKIRYSQNCEKTVLGFENNVEYLVKIRAFSFRKGRETVGAASETISFTPVCVRLTAQKAVCLKVGETVKIKCERDNSEPKIRSYSSSNEKIASVDMSGVITAKREGSCMVKIMAVDGEAFETKVEVERSLLSPENRAVIMLAGDIMCTLAQKRAAKGNSYDFTEAFSGISQTLSEADFSVGVLEATCYDGAPFEDERLRLDNGASNSNSPSTFLSAISGAGFKGLVTATNHNCDAGADGLYETVRRIEALGMKNIGTIGRNPIIVRIKGIKVAFIALCMASNGLEGTVADNQHMTTTLGRFGRKNFERLVFRAKSRGAEYIIAYQHWGSMNTPAVLEHQVETAEFMANAGVDLIVGSHPHVVQRISYIETDDGRTVPCFYSLGNFLSTMSDNRENRDGIILRAELIKKNGTVSAELSYIPVFSENREFGAAVVRAFPSHSVHTHESFERTARIIGKKLRCYTYRPKIMLSGSSLLRKIFRSGNGFRIDDTAMFVSQLSLGSKPLKPEEKCEGRLLLEFTKDISEYIFDTDPDFIAVDFFGAGVYSCLRIDDGNGQTYFTNTKSFVRSEYFDKHKEELLKIRPPFGEAIFRPLVRSYAEKLSSSGKQIILFRTKITNSRVRRAELRTVPAPERTNRFIRAMEDYFIELVKPRIVDLSGKYFSSVSGDDFEEGYFEDAYRAVLEITSPLERTCVNKPDIDIWFERVLKYYDSMTLRSYSKRLLDMNCAADNIIAKTNKEFASTHRTRLLKLKTAGNCELSSVRRFFANDPYAEDICRAAEIIDAVQRGGLERTYDFFRPAFDEKYNIVKSIAKLLSIQTGLPVNESNAELVFLIRGKPQFRKYATDINMMTVDIWGSSVSRESLNCCRDAQSGKFIQKQAPILHYEEPIKIDFPAGTEAFRGNTYRRKTTIDSFTRNGFDVLEESNSSWILLDFYDVICRMAEYKGALFELDDFLISTDFYADIRKYCTECFLFEKRSMSYCSEKITKFAEEITELYGDNIILIKTEPKSDYITLDYKLEPFGSDKLNNIKRKFIALCEERFASVTKCFVIDISKKFYSSDKFAFGGANVVNYEDEFYRLAGYYISEILNGNTKKLYNEVDEDYILLRDLRLGR
ncbi:MAG: CapA family protein [Oscillospiraceae bacterium]|nr:CapA family protein [Oscillospiraceae bacterium]